LKICKETEKENGGLIQRVAKKLHHPLSRFEPWLRLANSVFRVFRVFRGSPLNNHEIHEIKKSETQDGVFSEFCGNPGLMDE
jgi:hypothetical protein